MWPLLLERPLHLLMRLLGRFTEHVTIAFDGDQAGTEATMRSMQLLSEAGLNVRVAGSHRGKIPTDLPAPHRGRCASLA